MCTDITQAFQDITSIKPRQKILSKKVMKKKELTPKDVIESVQEERNGGEDETKVTTSEEMLEESMKRKEQSPVLTGVPSQDVPDGAQISKAFDTLCNIVRERMRRYKRPEPIADFYTRGRYVLVTGDGSYLDPCFHTSTPSGGRIFVTIRDEMTSPYDPSRRSTPSPLPPQPMVDPRPISPTIPPHGGEGKDDNKGGRAKDSEGKGKNKSGDPYPSPVPPPSKPSSHDPTPPGNKSKKNRDDNGPSRHTPKPAPRADSTSSSTTSTSTSTSSSSSFTPDTMSYEKVEVKESVEKFSSDRRVKGYEETSMVVETMIETSTKKKH